MVRWIFRDPSVLGSIPREMIDVLVVGSGPTSDSFISELDTLKTSVLVISPNINLVQSRFRFDISHVFSLSKFSAAVDYKAKMEESLFFPGFQNFQIAASGGLARHWGGGIAVPTQGEVGIGAEPYRRIYSEMERLAGFFGTTQQGSLEAIVQNLRNGILTKAILAPNIGYGQCTYCGMCNIKCATNVFYAGFQLSLAKPNVERVDGIVKHLATNMGGGWIATASIAGRSRVISAKRVVLCCGPLNTIAILEESGLIEGNKAEIKLLHNDCYQFICLGGSRLKFREPVGLRGGFDSSSGIDFYYSMTSGCHVSAGDLLVLVRSRVVRWILSLTRHYWSAGVIFLDSDSSSRIFPGRIEERTDIKRFGLFARIAAALFLTKRSLLLQMTRTPVGFDLHFGGSVPMRCGKQESAELAVDSECEVIGHTGLYILDGSILPRIPAKPTTFFLMANAMRVAKQFPTN